MITKKCAGMQAIFHGFDGIARPALIEKVQNGFAKILYDVRLRTGEMQRTTACIPRKYHFRITDVKPNQENQPCKS